MPDDSRLPEHGVHSTASRLTESLRSYIEAQYHIRDESLIRERRLLLEDAGAVSQRPYVESTPVYELGQAYAQLDIPQVVTAPVRFASYTGRTPYPGARSAKRDGERIAPLFDKFYLPIIADADKEARLRAIGQLPEKDLRAFFDKSAEEKGARGQRLRHWDKRLLTQPGDRELMTRHETQLRCPELLITNYSMLEYMLMRPIERPIFHQTREWLKADKTNELIIVLDEAHMYRGAGGAEVALLLRRLLALWDLT